MPYPCNFPVKRLVKAVRQYYAPLCVTFFATSLTVDVAESFPSALELSSLDGINGFALNGSQPDLAGGVVSDAGDVNGDGNADFIISGDANRSWLVFGRSDGNFPGQLDLSALNGSDGFALQGNESDNAGIAVSGAGDVNGDGFADLIIGAPVNTNSNDSGRSYIVFGRSSEFTAELLLGELDGSDGFSINGVNSSNNIGAAVSAVGDINGDGIDDFTIGAGFVLERSYVVFGRTDFTHPFELSSFDQSSGFVINGIEALSSQAIKPVNKAGDINADGIDDLIVGSPFANTNANNSGRSYVVFGRTENFPASLELTSINGVNGFVINGIGIDDRTGTSVSGAGDINDDGIDDLIIGSVNAGPPGSHQGYVVFGSSSDIVSPFELSALDGSNGFVFNKYDRGSQVSGAGDVNSDGIDDLVIGALSTGSPLASYVLFGRSEAFPAFLELSSLNGVDGFSINGINDKAGNSVSRGGDVNNDGIDDLIIAASAAAPNGSSSGQIYLVLGRSNGFSSPLELSSLDGSNGFILNGGGNVQTSLFRSISNAGDINHDGIDDLIIASSGTTQSYVIYGRSEGFTSPFQLSTLDGSNGFVLQGATNEYIGLMVNDAGDVNGDKIDDLIIGAPFTDPNGNNSGQSYVVFGRSENLPNPLQLSTLTGANGLTFNGSNALDYTGRSVSSAGDVNGDGFDDLLVGGFASDPGGAYSGQIYLVFGRSQSSAVPLELSSLDSSGGFKLNVDGFTLNGNYANGNVSHLLSSAGDINGDGFDDVIIGAPRVIVNGIRSGQSRVVFGRSDSFSDPLELSTLDGTNGFTLNGANIIDYNGYAVSSAGDINGDGFDDVIIGTLFDYFSPVTGAGKSYLILGHNNAFSNPIDLSSLDSSDGFLIKGANKYDYAGRSVSGAGDINGDGLDDLIIGAPRAKPNGHYEGQSLVVFGRSDGFTSPFELSTLDGFNGFVINGKRASDYSGTLVSNAGDINGDGVDDLSIMAPYADPNGELSGQAYVVFGTQADLSLNVAVSPASIDTEITYIITVTNHGPTYTSGVNVEFSFPSELTFTGSEPDDWNCTSLLQKVSCTLPSYLLANTQSIFYLNFSADQLSDFMINASVSSSDFDPDSGNNLILDTPPEMFADDFE